MCVCRPSWAETAIASPVCRLDDCQFLPHLSRFFALSIVRYDVPVHCRPSPFGPEASIHVAAAAAAGQR